MSGEVREPGGGRAGHTDGMPDVNDLAAGIGSLHERLDRIEHLVAETCVHPAERVHLHVGVPAWKRRTDGEARWQVAICVAVAIALQIAAPGRLAVLRPVWILPALQGVLFIALGVANPGRGKRHVDHRGRRQDGNAVQHVVAKPGFAGGRQVGHPGVAGDRIAEAEQRMVVHRPGEFHRLNGSAGTEALPLPFVARQIAHVGRSVEASRGAEVCPGNVASIGDCDEWIRHGLLARQRWKDLSGLPTALQAVA